MTREAARAYVERWKLVHDRDVRELQGRSARKKFEQLVGLFEFARALGRHRDESADNEVIRARWNRLRRNVVA